MSNTEWRKSTRSGVDNECVELRVTATTTGVRDSKNPTGDALSLDSATWAALLSSVKNV